MIRLALAILLTLALSGCAITFPQTVVAHRADGSTETCHYSSQLIYPGSTVVKDCQIEPKK